MNRMVIADAGPLIALARIDQLDLLRRLFGVVTVTAVVADEVLTGENFPDSAALARAVEQPWLRRASLGAESPDECRDLMNLYQIDLGEASAMVLAQQLQSQGDQVLLVMDDFRGRSAAQHAGLSLIGTTGLLLLAKQAGEVGLVKPLLLALRQQGYFLSQTLIDLACKQADE